MNIADPSGRAIDAYGLALWWWLRCTVFANERKKVLVKNLRFLVVFGGCWLSSCGGGGGSDDVSGPTVTTPPPAVTADNRVPFTAFSYDYTLPSGPLTVRYRVGSYQPSASFPKTSLYRVDDFAFFEVVTEGLNPGCPREDCGEEYAAPGPWNHRAYQILPSDINRDGVEDFYLFEWIHGTREPAPDDLVHAFINDGNGHFKLSNEQIFATGKACLHQGGEFPKDPTTKSKSSECGYTAGIPRHILVADFNGDGMDDIFAGMVLHLSEAGKLHNRTLISQTTLEVRRWGPCLLMTRLPVTSMATEISISLSHRYTGLSKVCGLTEPQYQDALNASPQFRGQC